MRVDLHRLDWRVIDDGVMGGRSRGRIERVDGALVFSGELSTANNGGFSSIRCRLPARRTGFAAAHLVLRGDGRRYQFRLRDSDAANAPAWRAFFSTDGEVQGVELPRSAFETVVRGRRVESERSLAECRPAFGGFMLTSDRDGPFRLELLELLLVYEAAEDD